MQEIIIADLTSPAHAAAIVYLLNEYAKDEMGGGAELPAFVQDYFNDTCKMHIQ